MDAQRRLELRRLAERARMGIIEGVFHAKSGHPGGSLSSADLLTYLYFEQMRIDTKNSKWEGRDRFVLSKGHVAPGLYAVLALRGFFPVEALKTLRKNGSFLQGHPSMKLTPGVDMSTGSLGQGISAAAGIALGAKLAGQDIVTYALLGDGEIQEGQVWEAAMFAAAKGLDHLIAIVDNNNLQIDGAVAEVNSPYPIPEKFAAFGWNTIEADAHDFDALEAAFTQAKAFNGKPSVIIMKSIKGKGVSFMEDQAAWHGTAPNAEQYTAAMQEIEARLAALAK
ncbi:MAG: transketolase [Oscillospiraceae bacterium]|jgi:transketolase|nr:transketolase [Oscillospiraceae bacterium]